MRRSLAEDCSVFATVAGAMTPAGLHTSVLNPLIEAGAISVLTTTGANLYHDAHRLLGHAIHEVNPRGDDLEYRRDGTIRIYDLGFAEEVLLDTDRFFLDLLRRPEFQTELTTPEMHWRLGRAIAEIEDSIEAPVRTLLGTCYRYDVPIFVGAPQDGSIFLNVVKLTRTDPSFGFRLDVARDAFQMSALQHFAREEDGKTAIWIFGGGVPKNYTLQGEPLLDQIFDVPARGFDYDVQICVDVEDNGALSGCSAGEGHTWGKTSAECVESRSVYLRSDVTLAAPFLAQALLSEPELRREPKRLARRLDEAERMLDEAISENSNSGSGAAARGDEVSS